MMNDVNQLPFEVEKLESREMLAGDVDVIVRDGDVFVLGDSQDNSIEVSLDINGGLVVTGLDGTTVNGGETGIVANNLTIRMRGGDDTVVVQTDPNLDITSNELSIFGNAGDDRIELKCGVGGKTDIRTGAGENFVFTENFFPQDDVSISGGCYRDEIRLTMVQATNVHFDVKTRGGADIVDVISSNFNSLNLQTGGGGDAVRVAAEGIGNPLQVSIAGESSIALGAGSDALETNFSSLFSFGHPAQDNPNSVDDRPIAMAASAGRTVESLISPIISMDPFLVFASPDATLTVSGQGGNDSLVVNGNSASSASASSLGRAVSFDAFESGDAGN